MHRIARTIAALAFAALAAACASTSHDAPGCRGEEFPLNPVAEAAR